MVATAGLGRETFCGHVKGRSADKGNIVRRAWMSECRVVGQQCVVLCQYNMVGSRESSRTATDYHIPRYGT